MDSSVGERLLSVARELIAVSDDGYVDGDEVARHAGYDINDPSVYRAFRDIDDRGELRLEGWGGGMGLPHLVRLTEYDHHPAIARSRRRTYRYLTAPWRYIGSDQNRIVDRILVGVAVTVVGGALLATIALVAGLDTGTGSVQTSTTRASKASPNPHPGDGRDPKESGCSPPAEDVPGTAVVLAGHGLTFGTLVLRHSPRCDTAWGTVRGLGPEEKLRLVLVARRPSDHAMTSYAQFGRFNVEGVYGNELFQTHGCVLVIAVVEHNGKRLARAQTPCR